MDKNREFKFRAWDKERKRFLTDIGFCDNRIPSNYHNYFVFQEFTGLKDIGGLEIYEGDVVYLAGYGNYVVEFPFIELYEGRNENDIGAILGNIFENPELLKYSLDAPQTH